MEPWIVIDLWERISPCTKPAALLFAFRFQFPEADTNLLRLVRALLLRVAGKYFGRSHELSATRLTPDSLAKVDVQAISAIRRQKMTNLESSPSLFRLKVRHSLC